MADSISAYTMKTSGRVGEAQYTLGATPETRMDRQGGTLVSNLHGAYTEQVLNGNVFHASNQAVVSTTAALATTWTGLGVGNPTGSGYNISLLAVGVGQGAAGAAGAVGIMQATMTGLAAAIAPQNCRLGGRASPMYVDDGATISTPILVRVFGSVGSLATTGYGLLQGLWVNIDGGIVIPPGYSILSYTTAATTSATIWTFVWEEIPI